jgi:hypothetical protein
MKKILSILFIFLVGCTKPDLPLPEVLSVDDIFSVTESSIYDGQSIHFKLSSSGTYTLTLIDKETNQVISRERFTGQSGENIKKIYTKSIQSKYLYLTLVDGNNNQVAKTQITITK